MIFVILMASLTCAEIESIELSNDIVQPGDTLRIDIELTNDRNETVIWDLEISISYYDPDGEIPSRMFSIPEIELASGETIIENISMLISERMDSGRYNVYISLRENSSLIESNTTSFTITGAKELINAFLLLCDEENCTRSKSKNLFLRNDTIFIEYEADISSLTVDLQVVTPSDENITLSFDNFMCSFEPDETGTYDIYAIFSREGYLEKTIHKAIEVIQEDVQIKVVTFSCDLDGECELNESYQDCPQDCPSGEEDGICDLVEDEICDPDCNETRDEDCRIDYGVPVEEGWNLISFPLERLEGISAFILPLFFLLGILVWRIYI